MNPVKWAFADSDDDLDATSGEPHPRPPLSPGEGRTKGDGHCVAAPGECAQAQLGAAQPRILPLLVTGEGRGWGSPDVASRSSSESAKAHLTGFIVPGLYDVHLRLLAPYLQP